MMMLRPAAVLALAGWAALWQTGFAWPHSAPTGWSYPLSCCSTMDCREMADAEMRETADGYLVVPTGEIVPYADTRVRPSPDGRFHWCSHQSGPDLGKTICLFVPPRGF